MDGQMNFLAIISRKDNPMLSIVLEEFNETISFLFDRPDKNESIAGHGKYSRLVGAQA